MEGKSGGFPACAGYWAEAVVDAAEKADRLSADDERDTQRIPPGGTPGYTVLTLRSGFTVMEDLLLTVALENVTDEDYRIHGSGVNEAGRNLVVQADWTF
jgi:hemoglobin/transferrin/lactoferrin receptor protein